MDYLAHSSREGIPEQSYYDHVSNVLKMARDNAQRVAAHSNYGPLLQQAMEYAALYHDLGKLDTENQRVLRTGKGKLPMKHWDAGPAYLLSAQTSIIHNLAALSIYSHHTGLPSLPAEAAKGKGKIFRECARDPSGRIIKEVTDERLADYVNAHQSTLANVDAIPNMQWQGPNPTSLLMRMALSCLVDADHTDTARHYNKVVSEGNIPLIADSRLQSLDRYVAGLATNEAEKQEVFRLRQQVYDACRNAGPSGSGMIACDSPVGSGKTTAVMAHLLNVAKLRGLRRVFVVLPFTNIIDQSVDVYRKALVQEGEEPDKVIAAHHHQAEFEDMETRVFSFLWNAPITVTTAVQFFETIASNHPAKLRKLHQVAGSAIFIDEAHAALPAHLWPQAWKWLRELVEDWGCYIVLASGSLTRFWELEEFSTPPVILPELVIEDVRQNTLEAESSRVCYRQKNVSLDLDGVCDWVREMPGPRLLILNTVHSAAAVAKRLAEVSRQRNCVEHLSTALAPMHRRATIKRIKKRLSNSDDADWTLVATSCVEAGVDFSFRTAAREFCSLVSTIQTAGRINRSGEYGESELWNFKIIAGDSLKEHPSFRLSARILEDFFKEEKVSSEYCKEAMKREVRESNQGNSENDPIVKAERNKDFHGVEEKFEVIDKNTLTVVVDQGLRERLEQHEKASPSELQQKSVNIYSYLKDKFALKPLDGLPSLYAWTLAYDDFLGYMAGVLKLNNDPNNFVV